MHRSGDQLWNHSPIVKAARQLLIYHLEHWAAIDVVYFDSWWDGRWKNFLGAEKPAFILLSDGEGHENQGMFLSMLASVIVCRVHVALLRGANIFNGKFEAFSIHNASSMGLLTKKCERLEEQILRMESSFRSSNPLSKSMSISPTLVKFINWGVKRAGSDTDWNKTLSGGFRYVAAVYCCGCVLHPGKPRKHQQREHIIQVRQQAWLAQVYLYHIVLLHHFGIDPRTQCESQIPKHGVEVLNQFLAKVHNALHCGDRKSVV